jgi:aminoglycoside phosphotransferase (APT) family kinase protein
VPLNSIDSDALGRLGRMLSVLHALPIDAPDRNHTHVPGAAALRMLAEADRRLPHAGFGLALDVVGRLWRQAESTIEGAGAEIARTVTVHGDVVTTNVLLRGSALALIDWDGTHRAPREYEFGTIVLDAPEALLAVVRGYCRASRASLNGDLVTAHAARYLLFGLSFHLARTLSDNHNAVQRRHDLHEAQRYTRICQNWPRVEAAVRGATTVRRRE